MPQIVEILAPSGTGKTTLYKGLQNKWKPEDPWAVYHDFRYKRKFRYRFPEDYVKSLGRKLSALRSDFMNSEIQYKKPSAGNRPNEKVFYEHHPKFCDAVIELIAEHNKSGFNSKDKRFLNTFFFFETIEHLQAVLNYTDDERDCVMDEGLLSRLMHLNSPTFSDRELNLYLEYMPAPSAVFYLRCEPEFIVERIFSRKKKATVHRGLSREEIFKTTQNTQHLMEKTLSMLPESKTSVIEVDATKDADDLVEFVYRSLKTRSLN